MTKEAAQAYIDSFKSKAGGWSRESLRHLGVSWPPKKGWRKELIRKMTNEIDIVRE